jgi:hypothetical protein
MIKKPSKLAGCAASILALAATANADVKVNEHISVNGYVIGAYTNTDWDGGPSTDTYFDSGANNLDAVKLGVLASNGPLSAYGSVLHIPGAANEAGLLEAFVTYDTGIGAKITGGKFLSYLGYEAFDAANMTQLSYALISGIPAYHTGAKVDFSGEGFSVGVAVVDSIFSHPTKPTFFEGDREYDEDVGVEVMFSYTGIDKLTVFAGIASEEDEQTNSDIFVFDLWASYAVSDKVTIAGEFAVNEDVADTWLAFLSYKFSDKVSTIFRISGAELDAGGSDMKYTVAPTYSFNDNLALRAEYSIGEGDSGDYNFAGVQVVFKF